MQRLFLRDDAQHEAVAHACSHRGGGYGIAAPLPVNPRWQHAAGSERSNRHGGGGRLAQRDVRYGEFNFGRAAHNQMASRLSVCV